MNQNELNECEWKDPQNRSTLTFNSPRDSRLFVPKRLGFGVTLNFGHASGKLLFLVLLALPLVMLAIVWLAGFFGHK